jgi:hypothetical protein
MVRACKFLFLILAYAKFLRYNPNMKALCKINLAWSSKLAYAIGLIATDGNLSKDGRHVVFVSKDLQLIKTFKNCLGLTNKICEKKSGFVPTNRAYFVQFGDVNFYRFLLRIGLTPAKSKTLKALKIPRQYFFDFLRGSFDGDGSLYAYWDKRWASSYLFYLSFISASRAHLLWLQRIIQGHIKVKGHMSKNIYSSVYQLKYAKTEAKTIFLRMYHSPNVPRLERKYKKVYTILAVDRNHSL